MVHKKKCFRSELFRKKNFPLNILLISDPGEEKWSSKNEKDACECPGLLQTSISWKMKDSLPSRSSHLPFQHGRERYTTCQSQVGYLVATWKSLQAPHVPYQAYCWWFRNPKANHLGCGQNTANHGISTRNLPQLVFVYRISGCHQQ